MQFATVGPASSSARAQLLLALLILAVVPAAMISIPTRTDGLTFDMGTIPEHLAPGLTPNHAGWLSPRSRARSRAYFLSLYRPGPDGRRHRLELLPNGQLLFEARPISLDALGPRLVRTDGWVDFQPDPAARYGDVVETLLVVARLGFDRLRLDNSRYPNLW